MSDDLRSRCIIAMRDAIGGYAYDHLGNPEYPFEGATAARLALDAMLDCLTENADEWEVEAASTGTEYITNRDRLAALRDGDE